MREREKWTVIFAGILVFSGIILISSSQNYVVKTVETMEENGIEYAMHATEDSSLLNGTSLTRYYNYGEKISLRFTHNIKKSPALPDLLPPLNFTIISPSGKETVFMYWLTPYYSSSSGFPQIAISELEILKTDGLILDTSPNIKFIGETTEDGNYTLVYTSKYVPLKHLAITKITPEKKYPYTFMLPFGVAFAIIGAILALWAIKSSRRPRLKKKLRVKG